MTTSKQDKHKPAEPATQTPGEKGLDSKAEHLNALLQLEDDFAEFVCLSAFLTNALAVTIKEPEWLTPEIVSGARFCACRMQQQAGELKSELHALRASYCKAATKEKKTA